MENSAEGMCSVLYVGFLLPAICHEGSAFLVVFRFKRVPPQTFVRGWRMDKNISDITIST
jgi:hypothetical protein